MLWKLDGGQRRSAEKSRICSVIHVVNLGGQMMTTLQTQRYSTNKGLGGGTRVGPSTVVALDGGTKSMIG